MTLDGLREYCLSLKGTSECLPFGPDTLVFKVLKKMFALTGLDEVNLSVNLKCDPERAAELREQYEEVEPGFHMNKSLWNTVDCTGSLSDAFIKELIDHSYAEVVKKMTKKEKEELESL